MDNSKIFFAERRIQNANISLLSEYTGRSDENETETFSGPTTIFFEVDFSLKEYCEFDMFS